MSKPSLWHASSEMQQPTVAVGSTPTLRSDAEQTRHPAPQLYGREWELASLRDARRRVAETGTCELVLITGEPGTGKTALAQRLLYHGDGDMWLRGCSACRPPSDPALPELVVTGLNEALHEILGRPEQRQQWWRDHIAGWFDENKAEACRLFGALRPFLGPMPATEPALPPQHARARRRYLLRRLLMTLIASPHPLTLFFDDLQWISPAEVEDLLSLLCVPELKQVMLVGAFRTSEAVQGHPLREMLIQVKTETRVRVSTVELRNLDRDDTCRLVGSLLHRAGADSCDTGTLVYERTHGNPLFVHQFAARLRMHAPTGDRAAPAAVLMDMAGLGIADSVVQFVIERLGELPETIRRALFVTACLGGACEKRDLDALLPLMGDGPGLDERLRVAVSCTLIACDGHRVRFLHDRIREAAYELQTPEERERMHAHIARRLLDSRHADSNDDRLMMVAGQIMLGACLIGGIDRDRAADLLLRAGARARDMGLFAEALGHFELGLSLLPASDEPSGTALELALSVAECRCLNGLLDKAELLFDSLLNNNPTDVTRLRIALLRTRFLSAQQRPADALKAASEAFNRLGIDYQADARVMPGLVAHEVRRTDEALARIGGVQALGALAPIEDQALLWAARAACESLAALFLGNSLLFALTTARLMRAVTVNGSFEQMWHTLTMYAVTGYMVNGDVTRATELCRAADRLVEETGDTFALGRTCLVHGTFMVHYHAHIEQAAAMLRKALKLTNASGDLLCAGLASVALAAARLYSACPLEQLAGELLDIEQHLRRIDNRYFLAVSAVRRRLVDALRGVAERPEALADTPEEDQALMRRLESAEGGAGAFHVHFYREVLLVFLGQYREAFAAAELAEAKSGATGSNIITPMHRFYRLPAIAGCAHQSSPSDKTDLLALGDEQLRAFERWKAACPANFGSHHLVAAGTLARARGEYDTALRLLAEAVDEAREHGFIQVQALAHRSMGDVWHELGRQAVGDMHLRQANDCFERRGARALVGRPGPALSDPSRTARSKTSDAPSTSMARLDCWDCELISSSARTVCEAVDAGGLGARLLETVASHSLASNGSLVLASGDTLEIVAVLDNRGSSARRKPLDTNRYVAASIARAAYRTGDAIRIDDLTEHHPYRSDGYFGGSRTGSVVCLPLRHGETVLGVLFLMSNSPGAYTEYRTALVAGLLTQVSVAFRNAVLIEELRATNRLLVQENQERRSAERRLKSAEAALSRGKRRLEHKNTALHEVLRELKAQRRTTREELIAGLEQSLYTNLAAEATGRNGTAEKRDSHFGAVRASLRTLAPDYVVDLNDRRPGRPGGG